MKPSDAPTFPFGRHFKLAGVVVNHDEPSIEFIVSPVLLFSDKFLKSDRQAIVCSKGVDGTNGMMLLLTEEARQIPGFEDLFKAKKPYMVPNNVIVRLTVNYGPPVDLSVTTHFHECIKTIFTGKTIGTCCNRPAVQLDK